MVFVMGWIGMRQQAAVGDRRFLRSMIPHHSGAIFMCQEAALTNPEVIVLCRTIVESQKQEIATMKAMLAGK